MRRQQELHLKAPGGWINDPNGFIWYQGEYHLFYQHFPYAPVWGTMHWGHAVSSDLIHWEHKDIALFPTKDYDQNGIFSGSAIEKDGKLYLYYSAVRYLEHLEGNIHVPKNDNYETSQALVISEDGKTFDNWDGKQKIIPVIRDEETADAVHTRDPKVWKGKDRYYMILGSTVSKKQGRVVFFQSEDAQNWSYVNQYRNSAYGEILECPDLFQVDGQYVFIGSPMHIMGDGLEYDNQSVCTLAKFEEETCELSLPGSCQFVDYGLDLYAPQTNIDQDGRRVMIAWMRMPKAVPGKDGEADWNGMMCLPRVVKVRDGQICFEVHPSVETYFSREVEEIGAVDYRKPYRIKTTLKPGETLSVGGYQIWADGERDCICTDRSRVFAGIEGYRMQAETPALGGRYELDIFVEPNLIEIFVNGGQYVLSHVVYGLEEKTEGHIEKIFVQG